MTTIYTHKIDEIIPEFKLITESDENTINFFKTFSYRTIIDQNNIKMNSINVFNNANNENITKSTIISYLNKLNIRNISKITSSLREIEFKTVDDLNELVTQCISKIKKDTEQMKPVTAMLCYELLTTFFTTEEGDKIYFRNQLLTQIKTEYVQSIDFESNEWTKEKGEKTTVLVGILYNNKIIPENVFTSIINNYKEKINFNETIVDGNKVELIIGQFMILMSSVVLNSESIKLFDGLSEYLDGELLKYNEKKLISKKMGLICKNLMHEVDKFRTANVVVQTENS